MATKMKGLFKGIRYISQIFEEEDKEQEMQIGFPTDVKHVAHIGWDGPSAATTIDSSPSWMKEFKSPTGFQSAPLDSNGNNRENPEVKWVSEDSKKGNRITDSPGRDLPEVPRSSRRHNHSSEDNHNSNDSPRKKDSSTKSRQSRRNHSKDSSEGSVKSGRHVNEPGQPSDSASRGQPDLAKKSRRKKSKESDGGGSTRSNKSKDSDGGSTRSRSKDPEGSGSSRSRSKHAPCGPSAYSDHSLDDGNLRVAVGSDFEHAC
ncbi:hypothetical protein OROGR_025056 [Orobanche gracilis]